MKDFAEQIIDKKIVRGSLGKESKNEEY